MCNACVFYVFFLPDIRSNASNAKNLAKMPGMPIMYQKTDSQKHSKYTPIGPYLPKGSDVLLTILFGR